MLGIRGNLRGCCCESGSWVVTAASKFAWQFLTDCCWYVKPSKTLRENKSIIGKLGTWLTWDNKMQLPLGSPAGTSPSPQSCLANIKNAYFITQTDGARSPVTSSGNLETWAKLTAPVAWLKGGTGIAWRWDRSRRLCQPLIYTGMFVWEESKTIHTLNTLSNGKELFKRPQIAPGSYQINANMAEWASVNSDKMSWANIPVCPHQQNSFNDIF